VIKADARLSISGGVAHGRQAEKALRRNVNDIDISVDGFEVPEILVSNISSDQLRILRQVKSDQGRHANHPVAEPDRLVAGLIRRMNDQ
jgi:hypothetical protein